MAGCLTEEHKNKISQALKGKVSPMFGKKHTAEAKARISIASLGKPKTDNHAKNISKGLTGIKHSEEHIKKVRESNKGKTRTEESKKRMSDAHKGISNVWGIGKRSRGKSKYAKNVPGWRERNKERIKLHRKKYKYNKKIAGKLTIKAIQLVYEDNIKKYGTLTCYLCKKPIDMQLKFFSKITSEHLEHKTPLSRGGSNDYENLGIACSRCNLKKGKKTVDEYLNKKGVK